MNIGAAAPASTAPAVNEYVSSSTAPYQASPTNSNASTLPLTQAVSNSSDQTFSASVVDHELNVINAPNPLGAPTGLTFGNTQPDPLAQSGVGIYVSAAQ